MVIFNCLMKINVADWLRKKIEEAGITQAELSRLSGISPTHITKVLNGQRGLSGHSLMAISKALGTSPENVYREAGLLPHVPQDIELQEELLYLFNQLPPDEKDELLSYLQIKLTLLERSGKIISSSTK